LRIWRKKGIEWLCTYIVDNVLVKVADPLLLGIGAESKVDIVAKVVPKAYPQEAVGVLARVNNKYAVLEYSEIDEEKRFAVDSNGVLLYNATHLVINNFSLAFTKNFCNEHFKDLPIHIARRNYNYNNNGVQKSIPCIKLELFAFDIFPFASKLQAVEMNRDEEFSPLKNSDETNKDCPKTCKEHLSNLHKRYIIQAGGIIEPGEGYCEISPLITYSGEGLEFLKDKIITLPFYLLGDTNLLSRV